MHQVMKFTPKGNFKTKKLVMKNNWEKILRQAKLYTSSLQERIRRSRE